MKTTQIVQKMSSDELKSVLGAGVELIGEFYDTVTDGFNLFKLFQLNDEILEVVGVLSLASTAWTQVKAGLSDEEAQDIVIHLKERFDIENDELEMRLEKLADLVPEIYRTISAGFQVVNGAIGLWGQIKDLTGSLRFNLPQA